MAGLRPVRMSSIADEYDAAGIGGAPLKAQLEARGRMEEDARSRPDGWKHCPRCGDDKPPDAFSPGQSWCRPCKSTYDADRVQARAAAPDAPKRRCPDCQLWKEEKEFNGQSYCPPCRRARRAGDPVTVTTAAERLDAPARTCSKCGSVEGQRGTRIQEDGTCTRHNRRPGRLHGGPPLPVQLVVTAERTTKLAEILVSMGFHRGDARLAAAHAVHDFEGLTQEEQVREALKMLGPKPTRPTPPIPEAEEANRPRISQDAEPATPHQVEEVEPRAESAEPVPDPPAEEVIWTQLLAFGETVTRLLAEAAEWRLRCEAAEGGEWERKYRELEGRVRSLLGEEGPAAAPPAPMG